MFNPVQLVIDAFIERLKQSYVGLYGILEPDFPNMIAFMGRLALENIANSDAPYHDVNHTINVTEVGQEILKGMHLREGRVSPRDWMHVTTALLCHDIGYVRGLCRGDEENRYVINDEDERVFLRPGATDASLAPHRVNRSKLFVRQRFAHVDQIDCDLVNTYIEHTRFPIPDAEIYRDSAGFAGLTRAADLIGEIADPSFLRNSAALFAEFVETGRASELGYETAADLRANYPRHFYDTLGPLIASGIRLLRITQAGKEWLANLYAQVYAEEHRIPAPGPERAAEWPGESEG